MDADVRTGMEWERWEDRLLARWAGKPAAFAAKRLMRTPGECAVRLRGLASREFGELRRCGGCRWHGRQGTCGVDVEGACRLGLEWFRTMRYGDAHRCHIGLTEIGEGE